MGNKKGVLITLLVSALALVGICFAFLNNASPYVTIAQAKAEGGDGIHIAGDIVGETMRTDPQKGVVEFRLKDADGTECDVTYKGPPPANMGSAKKVVVVGALQEGRFIADKMLVKCPSKYESEKK
jgi:cytochrome c-type biogenesis protein CcmE